MMSCTIEQNIYNWAVALPDKTAIKCGKVSVSYKELWQKILGAKSYFESIGYADSDAPVILSAGNRIEFIYAYFGAHLAGLKVAPIDPKTNPTRLSFIINQTRSRLLIGFDQPVDDSIECHSIASFANLSSDFYEPAFPSDSKVADILFTTGTTGEPKGVQLTYANESAAARNINIFIGNDTNDVELLALPVSHSFGLGRLRCCLSQGATLILIGGFANINKIFRTFSQEKVTGFTMVPASWRYLKKLSGNKIGEFSNQIRYIEMGSANFGMEEKEELSSLLPYTRICMHYGLTEASRSAFMEFHDDDAFLDSVGKPSPNTTIRIYDEKGIECPYDTEGEICIRGEHVMKAYLNKDNRNSFFDDFFRTGDWGYINNKGYLYLKSRKKDLINVGGKKVSPQEIENQILKMDGIEDCACIGVPDKNNVLGEVVKAFIVVNPSFTIDSEMIEQFLFDKLESYKIPSTYEWIASIPRTENGKIQRNQLR